MYLWCHAKYNKSNTRTSRHCRPEHGSTTAAIGSWQPEIGGGAEHLEPGALAWLFRNDAVTEAVNVNGGNMQNGGQQRQHAPSCQQLQSRPAHLRPPQVVLPYTPPFASIIPKNHFNMPSLHSTPRLHSPPSFHKTTSFCRDYTPRHASIRLKFRVQNASTRLQYHVQHASICHQHQQQQHP